MSLKLQTFLANNAKERSKLLVHDVFIFDDSVFSHYPSCRSQWPRGLRRGSAAACLLRLWVRIPPVGMDVFCCACCVLSGRSLCDELITLPEESYLLWCVVVCDVETSWMRRLWSTGGCRAKNKKQTLSISLIIVTATSATTTTTTTIIITTTIITVIVIFYISGEMLQ